MSTVIIKRRVPARIRESEAVIFDPGPFVEHSMIILEDENEDRL